MTQSRSQEQDELSLIHFNFLPREMLKYIFDLVMQTTINKKLSIVVVCKLWHEMIQDELNAFKEVKSIIDAIKNAINDTKKSISAKWSPGDNVEAKLVVREQHSDPLKRNINELLGVLTLLAAPSQDAPANIFALIELFKIHGSVAFSNIIQPEANGDFLFYKYLLTKTQRDPLKAVAYLSLAAKHNAYAEIMYERVVSSSQYQQLFCEETHMYPFSNAKGTHKKC